MIVVDCSINHLILFFTFFILSYSIQCSSNQDYVKIIMNTVTYADEISFLVKSESSTLFTSPSFSNNQEYVYEVCLNASSNHIYTLIMNDSYGDGWYHGGWISMNDINDNTIFKNTMVYGSEESYQFGLYSPINKNDTWRYSDSYHSLWNANSFNDNQWISIIFGSSSITSYNTQYFRKSFNGITGMASIDIQFYYSHGIIAYINGIEVFRDNMPHGIINHSTLATNSYSYSSYRGIILPAFYAQFNQSVISVELHFTSVNERTIDFNSFISYQSGISTDNPCSVYPHSISSSGSMTNPSYAFDYSWNYRAYISSSSLPAYVIGSFGTIIPLINSIRLYTLDYPDQSPSSFIVSGSDSDSSWTTLLTQSGQTYNRYSWKQWSLNSPSQFKSIKFTVNSVKSTDYAFIYELQFMTCNQPSTLSLPQSSYSFYVCDSLMLTIDMNGITNCMISPSLPQGLILNPSSCTISGSLSSSYSSLHTITAISGFNTFIRIVSIEIVSLISYPQTNLIIGQGVPFSITPNLTKVSTISIVSGSLPIGLSINPSTGVISGIPSKSVSAQSVTIEAVNGTAIETVVLSFTVQFIPSSDFIASSDWDSIPLNVQSLIFDSNSFPDMIDVDLSNFTSLQSLQFREGSFASASSLTIIGYHIFLYSFIGLTQLNTILFHNHSFPITHSIILQDLSVHSIQVGEDCFNGIGSFEGRRLDSTSISKLTLKNNGMLQEMKIPAGSFTQIKNIEMSNLQNLKMIEIEGEKGEKGAPFQSTSSFVTNGTPNLEVMKLGNKVCQSGSVFSIDSKMIKEVEIGKKCFQGTDKESQYGAKAQQFVMIDQPKLTSTKIDKSSFVYFDTYNLMNNPKQMIANIAYSKSGNSSVSVDDLPSFSGVKEIVMKNLTSLEETVFGKGSFPNVTVINLSELPVVKNITLEEGSFGKTEELILVNIGSGSADVIEIGNNTLSSVVRLTTSGTEMDMQLAEQLKNKIEEVTEDIDIEIDLLPPSLPSITLPSSSYSFLIHQSISFTIDMNGVMNCHITPSLPQGLILNRTTCTISGTLTSLSFSSYNITAISHSNTLIRIVSIEIISSLISYPQTNLIIGQGLSFSITPNLTKVSTISIVSGSLPIGLSINPSTGVISGSPSQLLSSQSVTIEAVSGTAIETVVLSFTVITPISSFSYPQSSYFLTKNHPFSIIPTVDGDEVSFSITSGSLPTGLSFNPSNGVISGTPSQFVVSQSVTISASNKVSNQTISLAFTVLASISSFSYPQSSYVLSKNSPFCISPTVDGDEQSFSIISGLLPTGLIFNSSTGMISGSPSQSVSSQSVTIKAFNQVSNQTISLAFTVLASISSFSYPQSSYVLSKNSPFCISPTVDGDELSFLTTFGSLPVGLSLNSSNGMISGTPSQSVSSQSVTIKVSNELENQLFSLSFTVLTPISSFSYPQFSYTLSIDESFFITPTVTGDNLSFSVSSASLPIGLLLNSSNGMISGIPSHSVSSQSVTIKAFNEVSNRTYSLSFSVLIPISSFSYPQTSYILSLGEDYSVSPEKQGTNPFFSITSGSLPIGLSLNSSTGMISGTPSQSISSQSVTIKAFNEVSDQSFSLSFTIQLIPSSLNYNQTIFIIQNNTYFIIKPTCEGDDLSFSIISGSLPIGLSFHSSTGIISGTPLSSIPLTSITIQASNQVGSTQFTISILVIIPLSNLHYSQFSFTLIKGQSFSISPIISGDNPLFTITSGTLPPGLSLNQSTGIISGIPSSTFPSTSITIQASNQLGFIQTQLSFTVNALSTLTIILISLSILIILIILIIIILIILSKKKKHTLPKKSIEEVKSVENRIPNPSHSV
ncbi:hypothetical protein WA171_002123 [Blastocystis sp. BT1]